jgi:hypothetical protein
MKKGSCFVDSERRIRGATPHEDGDLANLFSIVMSFLLLFLSRAWPAQNKRTLVSGAVCALTGLIKSYCSFHHSSWCYSGSLQDWILFPEVQLLLPTFEFYARINYVNYISRIPSRQTQLKWRDCLIGNGFFLYRICENENAEIRNNEMNCSIIPIHKYVTY